MAWEIPGCAQILLAVGGGVGFGSGAELISQGATAEGVVLHPQHLLLALPFSFLLCVPEAMLLSSTGEPFLLKRQKTSFFFLSEILFW